MLIDFWTYTCINCIRTLPHLVAWDKAYRDAGLTIVGVHSPEFSFENEDGQRRAGAQAERHRVPGRAGQRARHLERLEQPVLAGQVPDRRQGPRPLRALRRGRLRQDRGRDPRAAGRGGRTRPAPRQGRPRLRPEPRGDAGDLPRIRPRGALPAPPPAARQRDATRPTTATCRSRTSRSAARWRIDGESATAGPDATLRGERDRQGRLPRAVRPGNGRRSTVDGKHEQTVRVTTQKLYHLLSRPTPGAHDLRLTLLARRRRPTRSRSDRRRGAEVAHQELALA